MTTTALALSCGGYDPAACIARDGEVLAYVEEERLCREKHAVGRFPTGALREVLDLAGVAISEIQCISVNWDLPRFENGHMQSFYAESNRGRNIAMATLRWQRRNLQTYTHDSIRNYLHVKLREIGLSSTLPPIQSFPHHYIHAWHSFVMSGHSKANVLVLDGSGDSECSSFWLFDDATARLLSVRQIPNSLGWFYAAITEFLGFSAYDGEHKVMAMSAIGKPNSKLRAAIERLLPINGGEYELRPHLIHDGEHSFSWRFTDSLVELLGVEPKQQGQEFLQVHFDLAFEAQRQLEQAAISFALKSSTDKSVPLCLGGGVALNVTLGAALQRAFPQYPVFVNPLASDSGAIVGSALRATCQGNRIKQAGNLFLGRQFSQVHVEGLLSNRNLSWEAAEPSAILTQLLRGRLVGWFQGRAEAGPRALGARSILCDPRNEHAIDRLTNLIKRREVWQPYGLSVPATKLEETIAAKISSENMSIAVEILPEPIRKGLRAIHADGTTRPHVVHSDTQPLLHEVLVKFGAQTGVFALINTSLNRKGEPIAYSPEDALSVFCETQLDALVLENCLVLKEQSNHG